MRRLLVAAILATGAVLVPAAGTLADSATPGVTGVVVTPVPTYNGEPMPQLAPTPVTLPDSTGHRVTTGPAEAKAAARPVDDQAAYEATLCHQLQEAKPWIDWGCQ